MHPFDEKSKTYFHELKKNSLFFSSFPQISPYEARKLKKERGPNWGRGNFLLEKGIEETDSTK